MFSPHRAVDNRNKYCRFLVVVPAPPERSARFEHHDSAGCRELVHDVDLVQTGVERQARAYAHSPTNSGVESESASIWYAWRR